MGIVHLVVVKVLADNVGSDNSVVTVVDLLDVRVLPLEASLLFNLLVSVLLNGLEHSRSEVGLECAEGSFLFEGVDNNLLKFVHLFYNYF